MVFLGNQDFEKITFDFKGRHILSLTQFTPQSIQKLFKATDWIIKRLKKKKDINILTRSVATLLFFEPSTRTFLSFSSGIKKMGGKTVELLNPGQTSSFAKKESLSDSMKVFSAYTDLVIIRHPKRGFVQEAAAVSSVPVISGGDGDGEHPTQTLYDLYTIHQKFKRLKGLKGLLAGDLRHSRSMHSLIKGLGLFKDNELFLLSPKELRLSEDDKKEMKSNIKLTEIESYEDIPKDCDFWYSNRLQKERIKKNTKAVIKNYPVIDKELLIKKGNKNLIILDPLPRVGNIDEKIDEDPRALYLTKQLENGLYVRMALIGLVLGKL